MSSGTRVSPGPVGLNMHGKQSISPVRSRKCLNRISAPATSALPLPRALLVLAHPDDEVIAVGARLERFRESRLICVTDGAPRNGLDARAKGFASAADYAQARRAELEFALRLAGLDPERFVGNLQLGSPPRQLADQRAAWHLFELTLALVRELRKFQPEAVLTHPYEGGHPDHDACAFAVHTAIRLLKTPTVIVEAPFYHAGTGGIETGRFLCDRGAVIRGLSPDEIRNKRDRLACFVSQAETLRPFGIEEERFRLAPDYDFTVAPHAPPLFYENFSWGLSSKQFCGLATSALTQLQIEAAKVYLGKRCG